MMRIVFFPLVALFGLALQAAVYDWDTTAGDTSITDGNGNWSVGSGNWYDGTSYDQNWANGNDARFGVGSGGGSVTLGGDINANKVSFINGGTYTLDLDSHNLGLSNVHGALTVLNNGTAIINGTNGGTLSLDTTGKNNYTANLTGSLIINAKITGNGKMYTAGAGNLSLTNDANDFTGEVGKQNGGVLSLSSIADSGVASAAGAGSSLGIGYNAQLKYTGDGDSTNRTFRIFGNNSNLYNDGTGALVLTGDFVNHTDDGQVNGRTFTIRGSNTHADNEIQGNITDSTKADATSSLSVTKDDEGHWKLSGNNSYTGITTINNGELTVAHDNALGSTAAGTVLNGDSRLKLSGGVNIAEAITINSSGGNGHIFNQDGDNEISGLVTLQGGMDTRRSTGRLTFSGGITSSNNSRISLNLPVTIKDNAITLGTGDLTITSNNNDPANATEINVAGNEYGTLLINFGGYLKLGVNDALDPDSKLEFGWSRLDQSTGTLDLNSTSQTVAGLSHSASHTLHPGDDQNITGGGTLTINQGSDTRWGGRFTDGTTATNIIKAGSGTLTLDNQGSLASSNTGSFTINGGTLAVQSGKDIGDTAAVILANTAGVNFNVIADETIGSLRGGGATGGTTTIASGKTLTVAETNTYTFSGLLTGAGSLVKTGSGTMSLSGANTYTGTTTISAGTLRINGNHGSASGAVTVANGGTLGGSGTIGSATTVQSGGTLAPGNSPGVLTFQDDLTLQSGSATVMEIAGTTRGTGYDGIDIGGVFTMNGSLSISADTRIAGGTYDLFGINGSSSGTFTSVALAGQAYNNNALVKNGSTWTLVLSGISYTFSETTGDLAVVVPEPGQATLLLGCIASGLVLLLRRNRRRQL